MRCSQIRFRFSEEPIDKLTHYLFRYPAKFHPPVAKALIDTFTRPGETILDPFCGSGTLALEATILEHLSRLCAARLPDRCYKQVLKRPLIWKTRYLGCVSFRANISTACAQSPMRMT